MRFYRYCFTHYTHNIAKLRKLVSPEVYQAMFSIASTEPLPDFDGTLEIIRKGGKKAVGMNGSTSFYCENFINILFRLAKG